MDGISIEVIFVLIVMIVSAIKWFVENIASKNQPPFDEDKPGGTISTLEDLYEEARREIQERQAGTPSGPSTYWDEAQASPAAPATPPPLPEYSPPEKPKLSVAEQAALRRVQERQKTTSPGKRKASTSLHGLLSSPSAARNAVLLREILGPPKGAPDQQEHLA